MIGSELMNGVVYAREDCMVTWSQGLSPLARGDVWDAAAPLVAERPDLFSAEPTRIRGRQHGRPVVDAAETGAEQGDQPAAEPESVAVVDKPRRRRVS